jgi:hypothetical protein
MSHHAPTTGSDGRVASTTIGVVLGLAAAALLLWASFEFVFYGYCEDACDKPPRAFWPAVGAARPYVLAALGLMAVACYLFMRGRTSRRPSLFTSVVLAVVSSAAFLAAAWLMVIGLGSVVHTDNDAPFVLGILALVALWVLWTIRVARHAARSRPR